MGGRRFRVWVFIGCSLVLFVVSLLALLVNSDAALEVMLPGWRGSRCWLPGSIYEVLSVFAVDLSMVTTLVPVLVVGFPLYKAIRVLRSGGNDDVLRDCALYTYPDRFGFFLIMLGLVGTLYGMLIGLSVSGVGELSSSVLEPVDISRSLDRLLRGTATALWSSLVGIVGAFLVVLPVPMLVRWVIRLPREEADVGLVGTIEHLRKDLDRLAATARSATESFSFEGLEAMQVSAQVMGNAAEKLSAGVDRVAGPIEKSVDLQEKMAGFLMGVPALRTELELMGQRLEQMDNRFAQLLESQVRIQEQLRMLEALPEGLGRAHEGLGRVEGLLGKMETGARSRESEERKEAEALLTALRGVGEHSARDREQFRKAMALYSGMGE